MAKPYTSFTDNASGKRYFQIHDTITDLSHTIPLDLISFIQFNGIKNKEFIHALYLNFERLKFNGITLSGCLFSPNRNHKDVFHSEDKDSSGIKRDKLNKDLEQLFLSDFSFSSFYESYLILIDGINETLPRPVNYYYSISATKKMIDQPNELKSKFVNECIEHFKLGISEENFIELCIDKQYILKNKEAVAAFYYKLGKFNLIRLDAIPHLLRKTSKIEHLFKEYGAENLLPQFNPTYDLFSKADVHLKEFNDIFTFLQLVNHFSFSEFANSITLQGIELTKLSKDKLLELLNKHYYFHQGIINFVDQWGNIKQPMVNSSDFLLDFNKLKSDTYHSIVFLNYFGRQDYRMFNKKGRLIKEVGSYDFKLEDYKDVYSLWTHDSKFLCAKYFSDSSLLLQNEINPNVLTEGQPVDVKNIPSYDERIFLPDEKIKLFRLVSLTEKEQSTEHIILSETLFNQIELNNELAYYLKNNYLNNQLNFKGLNEELVKNGIFHPVQFQESEATHLQKHLTINHALCLDFCIYQISSFFENKPHQKYFTINDQDKFNSVENELRLFSVDSFSIAQLFEQLTQFFCSRGFDELQLLRLETEKLIELCVLTENELPF